MADDRDVAAAFLGGEGWAVALVDGWISQAASAFRRSLRWDWEDVRQEACLEVVAVLQQRRHRGESSLKTYLWRVVWHTCLDALRRRRRRPTVGLDELEAGLVSSDPSPMERLLRRERQDRSRAALAAMPWECQKLWYLILQGQSYRSIGARLGISEAALRVRAHRCRKAATRRCGASR
jgi:RNA polymerase sigma-70 factor, ECF subfamily